MPSLNKVLDALRDEKPYAAEQLMSDFHRATPLDPLTWSIAIRQADMIVRFMADQTLADGLVNGRLRKANRKRAAYAMTIADKLYGKLKEPPGTVGEAYAFDEKTKAEWPKIPEKYR